MDTLNSTLITSLFQDVYTQLDSFPSVKAFFSQSKLDNLNFNELKNNSETNNLVKANVFPSTISSEFGKDCDLQALALDINFISFKNRYSNVFPFSLSDKAAESNIRLEKSNFINQQKTEHLATPLLSVADFNGDGKVNFTDIKDIFSRYNSVDGDDLYHPLYDLDADRDIDFHDIIKAISTFGEDVPLLDRQIAQATQATMKYYGANGLANAIADGYLPLTPELEGHGIHYYNPTLADEVGNLEHLDIERPVGLNYDPEGNLLAVFYLRFPKRQEATPENPLAELLIDPADDFYPSSFDNIPTGAWHTH